MLNLAVVCQDTGAAYALAAYASSINLSFFNLQILCIGKACDVFRSADLVPDWEFEQDPHPELIHGLIEAMDIDAVLLGTSFDCWTERLLCMEMRKRGLFTMAIVDWWSNFGSRFSTPGSRDLKFLPDIIAVMDEDARDGCIADGIPSHLIRITGNPYWDYLKDYSRSIILKNRECIRRSLGVSSGALLGLIVSSNIRNLHLGLGYDETDFFTSTSPLPEYTKKGTPIAWVVKPHPKESPADLQEMLKKNNITLRLLENISAIEAVAASDFVLGMCSSVLFEAAILGKTVVSLQPGLSKDKLHYLRIFDHMGIPNIIHADRSKAVVHDMINGCIPGPVLSRVPFSLGNNVASDAITKLIKEGCGIENEWKVST